MPIVETLIGMFSYAGRNSQTDTGKHSALAFLY